MGVREEKTDKLKAMIWYSASNGDIYFLNCTWSLLKVHDGVFSYETVSI